MNRLYALPPSAEKIFAVSPVIVIVCAGRRTPADINLLKLDHDRLNPAPIYCATELGRIACARQEMRSIIVTMCNRDLVQFASRGHIRRRFWKVLYRDGVGCKED